MHQHTDKMRDGPDRAQVVAKETADGFDALVSNGDWQKGYAISRRFLDDYCEGRIARAPLPKSPHLVIYDDQTDNFLVLGLPPGGSVTDVIRDYPALFKDTHHGR